MYKAYFFLPLLLLLNSCENDDNREIDCAAVLCQANFNSFYMEFVDRKNDQNALASGTYTINDIELEGTASVAFEINKILEKELLVVTDSIWEIGTFEYKLTLGDVNEFKVILKLERTGGGGCCDNRLFLETLEINGDQQNVELVPLISVFVD